MKKAWVQLLVSGLCLSMFAVVLVEVSQEIIGSFTPLNLIRLVIIVSITVLGLRWFWIKARRILALTTSLPLKQKISREKSREIAKQVTNAQCLISLTEDFILSYLHPEDREDYQTELSRLKAEFGKVMQVWRNIEDFPSDQAGRKEVLVFDLAQAEGRLVKYWPQLVTLISRIQTKNNSRTLNAV